MGFLRFNFVTAHILVNLSKNSSNNNMSIDALQIETRHFKNAPLLVRTQPEIFFKSLKDCRLSDF